LANATKIAARVIELCLKELFVFREMQTDPNWSNFLWNAKTRQVRGCFLKKNEALSSSGQVELVDFGATRSYSHAFMDNWLRLLLAAAGQDREGCLRWSLELGYLTGEENDVSLKSSPVTHLTRCVYVAYERCPRRVFATARDAVPQRHPSTIRVWSWLDVGWHHGRYPRENTRYARSSSHTASAGDVLSQ
jgi:predicted unusual protein kinase regulating ubiquinone biosynthesis (AarF/ABC1/UbiB family)